MSSEKTSVAEREGSSLREDCSRELGFFLSAIRLFCSWWWVMRATQITLFRVIQGSRERLGWRGLQVEVAEPEWLKARSWARAPAA